MSLQEYWQKINPVKELKLPRGEGSQGSISFDENGVPIKFPLVRHVWLSLLIILVGLLGFGLGKLSNMNQSEPIQINMVDIDSNSTNSQLQTTNSSVTASSKGTRYYYSWCNNTISNKNKVNFATPLLAEKAGYTLATNCQPR
jgi:hypothetical protein